MKSFLLAVALGALAVVATPTPSKTAEEPPSKRASIPMVSVSGTAFYAGDSRFYIRGIDYQPGGSASRTDFLADFESCSRDITEFRKLGVNTVRVYQVDNSKDHQQCMNAMADAGIYLVLDLNSPSYSLNREDPHTSYNTAYLQSIFATVAEFAKYPNTLAFFSGNEVINDLPESTESAPYIKAITRDVRNFMSSQNLRPVPIGYSATDVKQTRMQTAMYMNCGPDILRSDFFAFNDYSYCNTDLATSDWDDKVKNFTDYGLPIFLSEWGCIENGRDFTEVEALMSSDMTSVYSGGLMYEYSLEPNNFGIVDLSDGQVRELEGFQKYADALKNNPAPTGNGGAATKTHSVECPTRDAVWDVDPSEIPAMPVEAEQLMQHGAGVGPGLEGSGSQNAVDSGLSPDVTTEHDAASSASGDDEAAAAHVTGGPLTWSMGVSLVMVLMGTMVL